MPLQSVGKVKTLHCLLVNIPNYGLFNKSQFGRLKGYILMMKRTEVIVTLAQCQGIDRGACLGQDEQKIGGSLTFQQDTRKISQLGFIVVTICIDSKQKT